MSVLSTIQGVCAERLLSDDFFAAIPVLTERINDIGSIMEKALVELGLCVMVLTPTFDVTYGNVPGPYFDKVKVVARVWEQVTVNSIVNPDGPLALDVCERICFLWHLFTPQGTSQALVADHPTIMLARVKEKNLLAYDVYFTCAAASTRMDTVVAPKITIADGICTLTCNTPGAAIYYTPDRSYPRAGNEAAILYTGPFAVSGEIITAAAYKTGWFPGSLAQVCAPVFSAPPTAGTPVLNEDGTPALNEDGTPVLNEN